MQNPADIINEALREAKIADYVLDITSKVVKDKKIVVSTLMHLKKSIILSMKSYLSYLKEKYPINVQQGEFQAHMKVNIINDGPVTLLLDSQKLF